MPRPAPPGEIMLPPNFEFYTPEQQAQFQQAATATNNTTFNYILPALGAALRALLVWLVISWLLHLVQTLLGGRGASQQVINVVAWASLPLSCAPSCRSSPCSPPTGLSPGSGWPASRRPVRGSLNVFLASVLGQIDLYSIWHIVLVYLGVRLSSQLPRAQVRAG